MRCQSKVSAASLFLLSSCTHIDRAPTALGLTQEYERPPHSPEAPLLSTPQQDLHLKAEDSTPQTDKLTYKY